MGIKLVNVLKTLAVAENKNENMLERFRKKQVDSKKWFRENKEKIKQEVFKAFDAEINKELKVIHGTLKASARECTIFLFNNEKYRSDSFRRLIPGEYLQALDFYQIGWWVPLSGVQNEEGGVKKSLTIFDSRFIKYLRDQGFVVRPHGKDFSATIRWSIPAHYGIDLSAVDWKEISGLVQLVYYHNRITHTTTDDIEQFEEFHKDKYKEYFDTLQNKLKEFKLTYKRLRDKYEKDLRGWFDDVKEYGSEPSYKMSLKMPENL